MKKIKIFISVALFMSMTFSASAKGGEKILVAGSGWNKIAIIDKDSKAIEWEYELENGVECNCVAVDKSGNIGYSYSKGARLISKDKNIIWDYKGKPGTEVQSIQVAKSGNFVISICGDPIRIVELDKKGKEVGITNFDSNIENPHGQHRQVKVSKRGTYILPITGKGEVLEITKKGDILRAVKAEGNVFSVVELPNGNWLIPCGDAHAILEVNPDTKEVINRIDNNNLKGVKLAFVAELTRYKNGNTLVANWLGHQKDKALPVLMEIDAENNVVWSITKDNGIGDISAALPLSGKFYR